MPGDIIRQRGEPGRHYVSSADVLQMKVKYMMCTVKGTYSPTRTKQVFHHKGLGPCRRVPGAAAVLREGALVVRPNPPGKVYLNLGSLYTF